MPGDPSQFPSGFVTEPSGSREGHCECCGNSTRRVWGLVSEAGATVAAYFVTWTVGKPDHGAAFDLVFGTWGDHTQVEDRYALALDFRVLDGVPQFMVVDAHGRMRAEGELFAKSFKRSEVIGTPLALQLFALVDCIYLSDKRLDELHQWH